MNVDKDVVCLFFPEELDLYIEFEDVVCLFHDELIIPKLLVFW
jgi:hypothetical protein